MKKIVYSDRWGQIVEYTRYRDTRPGKQGRFVSAKQAKRLRKYKAVPEVSQYRYADGHRYEPIQITRPHQQIKSTYPGAVIDYEGSIYEMVRDTNLFTQISKAETAFVNIRGYYGGEEVRIQGDFKLGERHQAEQLTMFIKQLLADHGFRTQYNLKLVQMSGKARREAAKLEELDDIQITTTISN